MDPPSSSKTVTTHRFVDGTVYSGGFKGGLFSGHGTLSWVNGSTYEGEFSNGKRWGKGKCTFGSGEAYNGQWEDDAMHGEGTLTVKGRSLKGTWTRGVPDFAPPSSGFKEFVFPDGKGTYIGTWRGGKRHGKGTFKFASGDVYEGAWQDGEIHGSGSYTHASGDIYTGDFDHGLMDGKGSYTWASSGQIYTGEWSQNLRHGHGKQCFSAGTTDRIGESSGETDYYEGGFEADEMHGEGVYVDACGEEHRGVWEGGVCPEIDYNHVPDSGTFAYKFVNGTYKGEWRNKKPDGVGCMVYKDGTIYEGEWRNFQFHGEGKLIQPDGVCRSGKWENGGIPAP